MVYDDDDDDGGGEQRWGKTTTTTNKAEARRRYESRRAKRNAFSGRGRGRGRGRVSVVAVDSDYDYDVVDGANSERQRRGRNADASDSMFAERETDGERGADLEALLRDAKLACLPRQRSDATYFDVEWTVDALRKMERESGVGGGIGDKGATDTAAASANLLVLDADALASYLSDASLATLLGLPEAYEDECGRDGSPLESLGHRETLEKRMTNTETAPTNVVVPVPQNAIEKEVGPESAPKSGAAAADDWLDELLDDES